ncbi:2958_t:CDS:2, partial [Gigaspora rosea]
YGKSTIWCYGLTKDSNINTFIMKIQMLKSIATGFNAIYKAGLVHGDLHMGYILHDDHE